MKRIYSITIHNVVNFGSVLQTYATQYLFERAGAEFKTIDYLPYRLTLKGRLKEVFLNSHAPLYKKITMFLTMDVLNRRVFDKFLDRHIKLTKRVRNIRELSGLRPLPDIYMTGSDQVWNSIHNKWINDTYYYNDIEGTKVSFSSSFGQSELSKDEKKKVVVWLKQYSLLSVREDTGVKLIKEMGIADEVEQILDPTLLLTAAEWRKLKSHVNTPQKYVLIYPMSGINPQLFKVARETAKQLNAEVWILSPGLKKYQECDRTLRFQSPERFLQLIDEAACVVTDSFHGTVFAINFNVPFISLLPQNFSTRIESILSLLGLSARIYKENFDYKSCGMVDFANANRVLGEERNKAFAYIEKILSL